MARKKKKGPTPPKKKTKKKQNPLAQLMQEHSELTREQAQEIVDAGQTFEEWEAAQQAAREERKRANQLRKAKLLCAQHPGLPEDKALICVQQNITPDELHEQERAARRRERQRERPPHRKGGGGRPQRKGPPNRRGKSNVNKQKQIALRKKRIEELLEKYPELTRAIAGQIAAGNLTYEQYRISCEKKQQKAQSHRTPEEIEAAKEAREERKQKLAARLEKESHLGQEGDSYIQELMENKIHIEVLRFHAPSFDGTIVGVEPFLLYLHTKTQPKLKLIKRYCTLFFKKEEQMQVYSQLSIAPNQFSLRQYPHREPSKRYHVPKDLLKANEPLHVLLHNGLMLNGTIIWADRFQFLLELPEGGEIFVFKHSVHHAANEAFEPEGGSLSLAEFFTNKPELPKLHPEALPPEEIEVPSNFDDFPVKDNVYKQYLEAFEQGDFELKPVTVRREGESYVLIDGYRRLTLAKDKGIGSLPIIVL
jgi:sRNA-binding regulator protein Hfq